MNERTGNHGGHPAHEPPPGAHFILVPGAFTGGWVWEETAAHLTAAGAQAHAVTLVGPEGARPGGPAPDLEAHIAAVVRAIDAVEETGTAGATAEPAEGPAGSAPAGPGDAPGTEAAASTRAPAPGIVLVGHGYGLHPALGAADRRPDRVARLIALDTAPPQDGQPAWTTVPDQRVREELAGHAGAAPAGGGAGSRPATASGAPGGVPGVPGGALPAPGSPAAWHRWGSTASLPAAALERLTRDAAPQPLGTLLQPLRLTGAAAGIPTTGILCTANGASVDLVQIQVDLGEPALQPLTAPGVRFLELPTGHWPMLSDPAGLADVLLRAAAGEGRRLTPAGSQPPPHLRPFVLDVPEVPRERNETVDLYLPGGGGPHPAVLLVHGGPVPKSARPAPRDWPALTGYARLIAAHGAIGAVLDHRLHDLDGYPDAAEDIAAAVARLRADPRVDGDRIALWFFSGGGLLTADWLSAPPPWLSCLAANYPILAPLPNWGLDGDRFRPVAAVRGAGDLPLVVVRAGRELPELAATVEEFLTAAAEHGATVDVIDVPEGHHGFETADHHADADRDALRDAVRSAVRTVVDHLTRP
ncbi:alpha/beta hydrolase [Streptomyces sp. BBFR2]|uniref:alpha/beta hydrolase n=1 Tax=Streptomyces sp. BBFR2 TaxID=3372854 RepID=UPI0037DA3246